MQGNYIPLSNAIESSLPLNCFFFSTSKRHPLPTRHSPLDSKLMSEEQREIAFEALQNHSEIKTTIHVNDNDRIDEINILAASLEVWYPR